MEQNNFEKSTRQQLEELRVTPSEAVWANVERKVRQKRRRRKLALVLSIISLIMALSGGYWMVEHMGRNEEKELFETQVTSIPKKDEHGNLKTQIAIPTDSNQFQSDNKQIDTTKTSIQLQDHTIHSELQNTENPTSFETQKSSSYDSFRTTTTTEIAGAQSKSSSGFINQPSTISLRRDEAKIGPPISAPGLDQQLSISSFTSPFQSVTQNLTGSVDEIAFMDDPGLPSKSDDDSVRSSKWKWGASVQGGQTLLDKVAFQSQPASDLMYYSPNLSTGGIPSTPNTSLLIKRRNAAAMGVKIFVERKLSRSVDISAGIQYSYFSFINEVGNRLDSSLTVYSAATYTHSYRNNLGFVEIPVSARFRLTSEHALPIYWNAGVAVSRLIHSNALQLHVTNRMYYVDNSFFRNMQVNLSAGFAVEVLKGKNFSINTGPYFYLQPSHLAKEGIYEQRRLISYGFNAEILFNKK